MGQVVTAAGHPPSRSAPPINPMRSASLWGEWHLTGQPDRGPDLADGFAGAALFTARLLRASSTSASFALAPATRTRTPSTRRARYAELVDCAADLLLPLSRDVRGEREVERGFFGSTGALRDAREPLGLLTGHSNVQCRRGSLGGSRPRE